MGDRQGRREGGWETGREGGKEDGTIDQVLKGGGEDGMDRGSEAKESTPRELGNLGVCGLSLWAMPIVLAFTIGSFPPPLCRTGAGPHH